MIQVFIWSLLGTALLYCDWLVLGQTQEGSNSPANLFKQIADSGSLLLLTENLYIVDQPIIIDKELSLWKAESAIFVELKFIGSGKLVIKDTNLELRSLSFDLSNSSEGNLIESINSSVHIQNLVIEWQVLATCIVKLFSFVDSRVSFTETLFSNLNFTSLGEGYLISLQSSILVLEGCLLNSIQLQGIWAVNSNASNISLLTTQLSKMILSSDQSGLIKATGNLIAYLFIAETINTNSAQSIIVLSSTTEKQTVIIESCRFIDFEEAKIIHIDAETQMAVSLTGCVFYKLRSTSPIILFRGPHILKIESNLLASNCYETEMIFISFAKQIIFQNNNFSHNNNDCSLLDLGTVLSFYSCENTLLFLNLFQATYSNYRVALLCLSNGKANKIVLIKNCSFSHNQVKYKNMEVPGVALYIEEYANSYLSIEECLFENNTLIGNEDSQKYGGPCLYAASRLLTISIIRTIFRKNKSYYDSNCVEAHFGSALSIQESIFLENSQYRYKNFYENVYGTSGAVYCAMENLLVNQSIFESNSNYLGGALFINGDRQIKRTYFLISFSKFIKNGASIGGGIFLGNQIWYFRGALILECTFENNKAELGAGVSFTFDIYNATVSTVNCKFRFNQAIFGGAIGFQHLHGTVQIIQCLFESNSAKSIYENDNGFGGGGRSLCLYGRYQTTVTSFKNLFKENFSIFTGGVVAIISGTFIDLGSIYEDNTALEAAAISGMLFSYIALQNCQIRRNKALKTNSAIRCYFFSVTIIQNTLFEDNLSSGQRGVLSIESESSLKIVNIIFVNNNATETSILWVSSVNQANIELDSVQIINSNSNGSIISVSSSSNIILKNITFLNNIGRVLECSDSSLSSTYVNVINNQCKNIIGCLAFLDKHSDIKFDSYSVSGISSPVEGGVLFFLDSIVYIHNVTIFNIDVNLQGGCCIQGTNSNFTSLNLTVFLENQGGIHFIGGIANLSYLNLIRIKDHSKLSRVLMFSSGIKCQNSRKIRIFSSIFEGDNVRCDRGSALLLISDSQFQATSEAEIENCSFFNNSADNEGGAVFAKNFKVLIKNSLFTKNSAPYGGAIYSDINIHCNCNLHLVNNTFNQNFAEIEGGALKYTSKEPVFPDNKMIGNKANIYGNDIAAFPIRMVGYYSSLLPEVEGNATHFFQMTGERPGKDLSYNLTFHIVDAYFSVVRSLTNKLAMVSAIEDPSSNANKNHFLKLRSEGIIKIENGSFTITNLNVLADQDITDCWLNISTPEMNFTLVNAILENVILSSNENLAPGGVYYILIPVKLGGCIVGEVYDNFSKICKKCEFGKYSYNSQIPECLICPPNAMCREAKIILNPGFWRLRNTSSNIFPCEPNPDACMGGEQSLCKEGYIGALCQACKREKDLLYMRTGTFECSKCESSELMTSFQATIFLLSVLTILTLLIWANLIDIQMLSKYSLTDEKSPQYLLKNKYILNKVCQSIVLKIFINYCQIISISRSLNLNWPSEISSILKMHGSFGQLTENIFSFDCIEIFDRNISILYWETAVFSLFPFLVLFLIILFWLTKRVIKNQGGSFTSFISSSVIFFLLIQPTILSLITKLIACKEIDEGKYYLVFDMSQECFTEEHAKYVLMIYIPMTLLWGVLIPSSLMMILKFKQKTLDEQKVRNRFGYLYYGYKIDYFYWEILVLFRKMAIIFIVLFYQFNNVLKVLYVLFVLGLALGLQMKKNPFYTNDLNNLEFYSILVSILTLFFALLYYLNSSAYMRLIFFLVVLTGNIVFLFFFFKKIIETNRPLIIKCLKRICLRLFMKENTKKKMKFWERNGFIAKLRNMIMSASTLKSAKTAKSNVKTNNEEGGA